MLGNLLDNALKWSPDGAVVEVTCGDGTVTVRDHGPGISAEDLPHIFDRFYRAPGARRLPGSGLGLAIVAQVAEDEGGSITAGSAIDGGGGAIFRLSFPPVPAPPPEWSQADGRGDEDEDEDMVDVEVEVEVEVEGVAVDVANVDADGVATSESVEQTGEQDTHRSDGHDQAAGGLSDQSPPNGTGRGVRTPGWGLPGG